MHEIDQKHRAQEDGFDGRGTVGGKLYPKVVGIGQRLLSEPAPFLVDRSEFDALVLDLEGPGLEQRSEELADFSSGRIGDRVDPTENGELFYDLSKQLPFGIENVGFVKNEPEGTSDFEDGLVVVVDDLHGERSKGFQEDSGDPGSADFSGVEERGPVLIDNLIFVFGFDCETVLTNFSS